MNVKQLRSYLETMEDHWTKEDADFLGAFETVKIYVEIPGIGLANATLYEDMTLGFIFAGEDGK